MIDRFRCARALAFVVLLAGMAALMAACRARREPAGDGGNSIDAARIQAIGTRGVTPGRFSFPRGIAIARRASEAGLIAISDKSGRIHLLEADGRPRLEWRLPRPDNGTPTGLCFDESDPATITLVVPDTHNSCVMRYTLGGRLIQQFGEYGGGPGRMIYPTGVAVDPHGAIYLTEYGEHDRVLKFDRDGRFLKQWGDFGTEPGQFQRPIGIEWLAGGRLLVADACNHRLQLFDEEGALLAVWGGAANDPGRFNYPYDVTTDAAGRVWVAEYGGNRLQCLDAAGRALGYFGGPGAALAQFASPWGIQAAPDGALWVADTNNHRLQGLRPETLFADANAAAGDQAGAPATPSAKGGPS